MPNTALLLSYAGTAFHGWAHQPGKRTVRGLLAAALQELCPGLQIHGMRVAARTDSGVHALWQVANLGIDRWEPARLARALNALLPRDLRILDAVEVPDTFDARRSALSKHYRYFLCPGGCRSPVLAPYAVDAPARLDVDAMSRAAELLRGPVDMRVFAAHEHMEAPAPRTILRSSVTTEGDVIVVDVEGDSFLRHAVRRIVGTLLWVGQTRLPPEAVREIASSGDPRRAGPTAPAHGLFLWRVTYPAAEAPAFRPLDHAALLHLPRLG